MSSWLLTSTLFLLLYGKRQAVSSQCTLPAWPAESVVNGWRHGGASEKCFCAYAQLGGMSLNDFTARCSSWVDYVSTDADTPNKVTQHGLATALGVIQGNASSSRYGSMTDWSIDLGSGYGQDCDRQLSKNCDPVGTHILTIPREQYLVDCCTNGSSLGVLLKSGDATRVCAIIRDMIEAALDQIDPSLLSVSDSCREENEDPTRENQCLAQCMHIIPDVNYLHMHSTVGVLSMRDGPVDSGLGPNYNETEKDNPKTGYGRYNLCACEPVSWTKAGRGACPRSRPTDAEYVTEATLSTCHNLAGIMGIDHSICSRCT